MDSEYHFNFWFLISIFSIEKPAAILIRTRTQSRPVTCHRTAIAGQLMAHQAMALQVTNTVHLRTHRTGIHRRLRLTTVLRCDRSTIMDHHLDRLCTVHRESSTGYWINSNSNWICLRSENSSSNWFCSRSSSNSLLWFVYCYSCQNFSRRIWWMTCWAATMMKMMMSLERATAITMAIVKWPNPIELLRHIVSVPIGLNWLGFSLSFFPNHRSSTKVSNQWSNAFRFDGHRSFHR